MTDATVERTLSDMAGEALLNKALRNVLQPALLYGWEIEWSGKRALWEGDTTMPFRAIASLEKLISYGLMEITCSTHGCHSYRHTKRALSYTCRAPGCNRGSLYEEGPDGYDVETRKCVACDGTGVTLAPSANSVIG